MKKIMILIICLSGFIFYGINNNADLLKDKFNFSGNNLIPGDDPTEIDNFKFANTTDHTDSKIICIQVDGVYYCRES